MVNKTGDTNTDRHNKLMYVHVTGNVPSVSLLIARNLDYVMCKTHLLGKILAPYEEGFFGAGEWLCGGLVVCRTVLGEGSKACAPTAMPSAVVVGVTGVGLPW